MQYDFSTGEETTEIFPEASNSPGLEICGDGGGAERLVFDNDTDTAAPNGSFVLLLESESVKYTSLPLSSVDFIGS